MQKRKTLPKTEDWHQECYKHLLIQHGWKKSAVRHINTIFLEILNTEDTPKNRDALRKRTRRINPNYPECHPETKAFLTAKRQEKSDFLKHTQKDDHDTCHLILDAVLDKSAQSYLTSDLDNVTIRDIVDLIEQKRKLNEYEAKLHGLLPKQTTDNESGNNISDKLSHAKRLLENTRETQSTDHREDGDGTHD